MIAWTNLGLVVADLAVLSALVLWLHRLSPRYGLAPLLLYLAALVTIVHTLGPIGVYVRVAPELVLVIGSTVMVPVALLGILIIYVVQGTAATRVTIFSIIGVSTLALGLHLLQSEHIALPGGGNVAGLPHDSPALTRSGAITFGSLLGFTASLTMVAIVHQTVTNVFPGTPRWLTPLFALLVALWTDALVFRTVAFGWAGFVDTVPATVLSKTLSALVMWPLAGWYLTKVAPGMPGYEEPGDRRALDLLFGTYGRQAETLSLVQAERRTTEHALRRAEAQLKTVISSAPIVFFALDREGRFTLSEGKGLEALGLKPGQVVGMSVYEVYPDLQETIRRALDGQVVSSELELEGLVWETTYTPVIEGDEVVGLTGVAVDVTERFHAERAMRDSERRFRSTFEQAAVGIAHVGLDGRFLRANARLAEMLGYTSEELQNMDFQAVTHPDDLADSQEKLRRTLHGGPETFSMEKCYVCADGGIVWANTTVALLRNEEGEPAYFVAVVEDITARKATEEQLRQAQKMEVVGQLTGGVAHDFNNLMTVIMGGLELAREEVRDRPNVVASLESALDATRKGASLTQRLLAFSRKQTLRPAVVDPRDLLEEMRDLLRTTLGETVEIETTMDPDLWSLLADRSQVENAVLNLVLNARDAMPDGGRLSIRGSNAPLDAARAEELGAVAGDYVLLEVADDGTGMTVETIQHAFEPFFTTKDVGKGSGLGLSMVYGFVNQSGGHVRIDSVTGRGTTVQLYMPRASDEAGLNADALPADVEPRGNGERILVVEDDAAVRSLVVRLLERLGYESLEAEDAQSALRALDDRPDVDLLFTDIILPGGMTGAALAQEALKIRPDLRVLYTSGYSRDALSQDGRLGPGVDLVEKPFEKAELASVLKEVFTR